MWICADLIRRTPVTQSFLDELPPGVSAEICMIRKWDWRYVCHYCSDCNFIQIPWLYVIMYYDNGNIFGEENMKN